MKSTMGRLWGKFVAQFTLLGACAIIPFPVLASAGPITAQQAGSWLILIQTHGLAVVISLLAIVAVWLIGKWIGKTLDTILTQARQESKEARETYSRDSKEQREFWAQERQKDREASQQQIRELNEHYDKRHEATVSSLDKIADRVDTGMKEVLSCYVDMNERTKNGKDNIN